MSAARGGSVEAVELLLSIGTEVNQKNAVGFNALYFAARVGHLEVMQALFEFGADLSAGKHVTALSMARYNGQQDTVYWLEQHGAVR